jgi:CheY-like chemotaxis protein
MSATVRVLMAEDDDGHATLVRRNLRRAGISAELIHLRDGQELLDYVFRREPWTDRSAHESIAILLDLNMPRLGGFEVLDALKGSDEGSRLPVFVLTTTDNPVEIDRCYSLGASVCIVKPLDYGAFGDVIQRLGEFLATAQLPGEAPARAPGR